jgi:hemerythrin-like domain-containing protein
MGPVAVRKDLVRILEGLRQDHKNMAILLTALEAETGRLSDLEEPDYLLMHDVMHYMTVYPDAVHHPREDLVYAEIARVRPELTSELQRIEFDHRSIAETGLKIRDDIASISSDGILTRSSIVEHASRYINALREHMQWEEAKMFRHVDDMIHDGHTTLDIPSLPDAHDPVFGPEVAAPFNRLFARIKQYIQAS